MEPLKLEGSHKTPDIDFNPTTGVLQISGTSIPEYARKFYDPIVDWVNEYAQNPSPQTKVVVKVEYFNSSSSACLVSLFNSLANIHKSDKTNALVEWYYEENDPNMEEAGELLKELVDIPIKLIEVAE